MSFCYLLQCISPFESLEDFRLASCRKKYTSHHQSYGLAPCHISKKEEQPLPFPRHTHIRLNQILRQRLLMAMTESRPNLSTIPCLTGLRKSTNREDIAAKALGLKLHLKTLWISLSFFAHLVGVMIFSAARGPPHQTHPTCQTNAKHLSSQKVVSNAKISTRKAGRTLASETNSHSILMKTCDSKNRCTEV